MVACCRLLKALDVQARKSGTETWLPRGVQADHRGNVRLQRHGSPGGLHQDLRAGGPFWIQAHLTLDLSDMVMPVETCWESSMPVAHECPAFIQWWTCKSGDPSYLVLKRTGPERVHLMDAGAINQLGG